MRSQLVAALTILLLLGSAVGASEGYAIKLSRPAEVGDRFTLEAKGSSSFRQSLSMGDQVVPGEQRGLRVELEADVEVLEVDDLGRILGQRLTVRRMVYGLTGGPDEAIEAGRRITAESAGIETRFSQSQGSLPELATEALSLVASTASKELPTDDQAFGSDQPRAIGASWPIDRDKSAEAWAAVGLPVDPDDISGTVTVEGLENFEGVECLRIKSKMTFAGFSLADLEPGTEVQSGSAEASFSRLYPTDVDSHLEYDMESLRMTFRIKVTEGQMAGAAIDTTSEQIVEITTIPVGD